MHLNSPDVLPPVNCPLVIKIGHVLVKAERTSHVQKRGREMEYRLENGALVVGRYEWSYP